MTQFEKTKNDDSTASTPKWAYLFAGACLLIPVVALGGALPVGLGVGGASLCWKLAKDESKTVQTRVMQCLATTVVCWGLFIGLLVLVFQASR